MLVLFVLLLVSFTSACAGSAPPTTTAPTMEVAKPAAAPAPAAPSPAVAPAAPSPVVAPAAPAPAPPAPAASPTASNPRDALATAFRTWGNTKTFRAKVTTEGAPAESGELNYEVVLPDRMHMKSEAVEVIVADGNGYIKVAGGPWQKLLQNLDMDLTNPEKMMEGVGATTQVKLIGPDVLDGQPMLVYEYTTTFSGAGAPGGMPAAGDKQESYTSKVWVAVSDGLPRRLEAESDGVKTTAIYYDFNAPITINPPQ